MSERGYMKGGEGQGVVPRSLRPAEWPAADRRAWEAARAPAGRLRRGGAAAHLAQITRDDLERRYGYFLDYLAREDLIDPTAPAAGQVTPERITGFLSELRERVRSVTVAQTIYKIRRMAEILAPEHNFMWLRDLESDLAFDAAPKSRNHQLVDGDLLLEAGLVMMKEGEVGENMPIIRRARLIRDGLMITLLSVCPIRLKNLSALELGESLRRERGAWWVTLDRRRTKGKRADERRLPDVLQSRIDLYLRCARPVLARQMRSWPRLDVAQEEALPRGALWLDSNQGHPMSYSGVERAVGEATRRSLGVTLRPHMFRVCTATTAYVIAGDNPHLASALLQHTDQRVTQKHYNLATNAQAAIVFGELIESESSET